jgi:hypothetical protein
MYNQTAGFWSIYGVPANACVGIGTSSTSASYKAYVGGALYATGNIVAYSDVRAKTNIITIDGALNKVLKLRGVYYEKIKCEEKDESQHGRRQLGVIAQEVNEVIPEVVTYDKENDQYGVSYANLAGLFIEAFKEQHAHIETLNARIEELENRLDI